MKFAVRQTTYTHTIFERKTLCAASRAIRASPPVSPKLTLKKYILGEEGDI
jgi:hypothetical protein